MIVFLIIYLLGVAAFFIHLYKLNPESRTKKKVIELALLYQLVFFVGITSFLSFFALTFMEESIAAYTEWPSCPYMQELGNVNLAFGVLCMIAIWLRKSFWTAIVIGFAIWILGDAIHHQWDAYTRNHFSHGNVGALFYTDLIIPLLLLVNLWFYDEKFD